MEIKQGVNFEHGFPGTLSFFSVAESSIGKLDIAHPVFVTDLSLEINMEPP